MTNSLALGCDCKRSIYYLAPYFPTLHGEARKIKNAICIHEEDDGILFKHTDFGDDSTIVTCARRLIAQQVFTAANYEYAIAVSINPEKTNKVPTSHRRLSLVGISRKYDTVNRNWLPTGII